MTRENDAMPTGVTQADRLAAAAELERNGRLDDASDMRRGMLDHFELVQAFARHRQPYIDALKEARDAIFEARNRLSECETGRISGCGEYDMEVTLSTIRDVAKNAQEPLTAQLTKIDELIGEE